MDIEKLTAQFRSALTQGQSIALGYGHGFIESLHILKALLNQNQGTTVPLLSQAGTDIDKCKNLVDTKLNSLAKVEGLEGSISISRELQNLLNLADQQAQKRHDSFIASDIFILSALKGNNSIKKVLIESGTDIDSFANAIESMRKGEKVRSSNDIPSQHALKQYTVDLTEQALNGKIDPVIGRDTEIRRTVQVLQRRTKNNPVLIGAPGVGKTAIAEGLAQRIVNNEVPEGLKGKTLLTLDMASLVAGAKYRGEFEERMKKVLQEISKAKGQIVLFIDELHVLVGAGRTDGALDASNMLKPALARGELHCIGATTLDEYRQYIEKDAALERRFQKVLVEEPTEEDTIAILRGIKERYELHHAVTITDQAIVASVELSQRYISGRQLPDKAIDLIDESASLIRMEMDSKPEDLDNLHRKIVQLKIEKKALNEDEEKRAKERLKAITQDLEKLEKKYADLEQLWQAEKAGIQGKQKIKEELDQARIDYDFASRNGDLEKMSQLQYGQIPELEKKLKQYDANLDVAKDNKILKSKVTEKEIAHVVAKWTGIPMEKMLASEKERLLGLPNALSKTVIGQDTAIDIVSKAIKRSRAGLSDPKKPIGSFLFLGPTGVGKTQLCKSLAQQLFDDQSAVQRIDMSEYMEKHAVARLIGAPPGYVGYDQGGYLTELVRRKPYSIVLFDEIEKAHEDIYNILLQVLDEGRLTDGQGRTVDFKHSVIVMTSNLGSVQINELQGEDSEVIRASVMDQVHKNFRPEFINRIDECIIFESLAKEQMLKILDLQLDILSERVEKQGIIFTLSKKAKDKVLEAGFDPQFGARPIKRSIEKLVENKLAEFILGNKIDGITKINIDYINGDLEAKLVKK